MPISFIQQKKKQKQLFLVVGAVLAVTVLVLWFGYFRQPQESFVPPITTTTSFVKDIKVNFEVLKNPFLKEFNIFEQIPPFEGDVGRENPFLPY